MSSSEQKNNACLLVHNSNRTDSAPERLHRPTHVHLYDKDVKIFIPGPVLGHDRAERKEISLFSDASKRRLLFVSRNSGHKIKSQITLSYHDDFPEDGKQVKKHLNNLLVRLRKKYPDVSYLWVLEFQKRGAAHYHLFTSMDHRNREFHEDIGEWWHMITTCDDPAHLRWHLHPKNFIKWNMKSGKYLAKEYLAKASQKDIPEEYHSVGRFWGNSRDMKPVPTVLDASEVPDFILTCTIRQITKAREKLLKRYIGKPVKLRGRHLSYSLPLLSTCFARVLEYMGAFGPLCDQVLF